jgi:hypothetical protein
MFWTATSDFHSPLGPRLVLGECKTFGSFERADLLKMKKLANYFPGAVLVFASLSPKLSVEEVRLLASFAKWGRKNWRAPVAVFTAKELASDFGPPLCWKDDAATKSFADNRFRLRGSLRALCDATQQIHLGLPASADWPHYQSP